jgi:hypothetical protein
MISEKKYFDHLSTLEAAAAAMKVQATKVIKECRRLKQLASGDVSTSADRQQEINDKAALAIANRMKRIEVPDDFPAIKKQA